VLAAALAGVLPAAVAQTAFTVNGQFVSVEEQKQLMDFLRANGVTNEKQLKNAARSILLEQKIIEQAARNEGLLEDPRVRVLISEKQAQLYGSILSRRYASEHPITEEQVRNRYDSLLSSYDPHEIKFRHILVKTPEEAREIIQSLKVCSEFVFVAVENLFFCLNFAVTLFRVPVKQVHRSGKVLSRFSRHRTNRFVALFKRYCGVGEESFFEFVYIVRVFFVVRLVPEYNRNYPFKQLCKRHKHNDCGKPEKSVHQRNGNHVHFHVHK